MPSLRRVLEELHGMPSVEAVGLTSLLPIGGGNQLAAVSIEGQPPDEAPRLSVNHRVVDGHFFSAMGMPLLAGRTFDDCDRAGGD